MIEVEQLSKLYGTSPAIQDVSFTVREGEILGFLGPNGAGKTTTMRILTGYLPATSGTARVAGFDVHDDSMAVRQRIGYLPETPPLYPEMTVEGFLHFVARIKGVVAGDRPERVNIAMTRCNLLDKRKILIRKLSKGFRQRVGIAQAIVHDPPVIILDEPTVGLDPRQIIDVRNLIKSLAGDHTIILSTHILPEVKMTCDRITIINRGQVVATNTPSELVSQLQGSTHYELDVAGSVDEVIPQIEQLDFVESVELKLETPETLSETATPSSPKQSGPDIESEQDHKSEPDIESEQDTDDAVEVQADEDMESREDSGAEDEGDRSETHPEPVAEQDDTNDQTVVEDEPNEENVRQAVPQDEGNGRLNLTVRFHPGAEGGPDLAKTVINAGLELYEMRRSQVSLEDVFLNLTTADPSLKSASMAQAESLLSAHAPVQSNATKTVTESSSSPEDDQALEPQEEN